MVEQEQHIRQAVERLLPHFTDLEVGSAAELEALIQAARDEVEAGNDPLDPTQGLAAADVDFYRQAIDALEADLTPVFEATDRMITALEGRGVDTPEFLADRMAAVSQHLHEHNDAPNYDSQLSAAERAMTIFRRRFYEAELQAVEDEGRWSLGLWDAYKTYMAGHDEAGVAVAGFDEADFIQTEVARLQGEGWESVSEDSLRQILTGASTLEREINGYLLDPAQLDSLTRDTIDQIRARIDEFRADVLNDAGVAEAQIFYNRLVIMHQNLERTWLADVDNRFVVDAEDRNMLATELNQYGGFLVAMNDLEDLLQGLKTNDVYLASPGELDESIRSELERLREALRAGEKFLTHRKVSPDNKERLKALYERLMGESEVLLGKQTDEGFVFADIDDETMGDLEWWMFTHHGEQWRAVQFFWEQYNASNAQALNLNPKYRRELTELVDYFVTQMRGLDRDDRAFHQRFMALDVQINRLQMILAAMDEIPQPEERVEPVGIPEKGLPSGFEHPEDTVGGWEQYYTEVAAALGPQFLRNQTKELREMLESQSDIGQSFSHQFHEDKRWDGLHRAMHNYEGPEHEDIHELATLFEMYKILFEAQVSPAHSVSMTCDMDQLPDWEHHGVGAELFDYFTLEEGEGKEGESRYKYSHYVQKLVQKLAEILYENPGPDFESREAGGSAVMNGVHQEGWFGYYFWKDTPENKRELLARMRHELETDIAPDLAEEDMDDVIFFAHRVATMCGIRQDLFAPYMACGATPVDMLGDLSKYIGDVNLFAPELYSTYKKRIYLQLAEVMAIPDEWWESMKGHKKNSTDRMRDIRKAFDTSQLLAETMSRPRERWDMPIADDGVRMQNTYYSMFDLFFNDEVRDKRRRESVTLKAWKRGKEEFVAFKEMCFDLPGGVDVTNITQHSKEELSEKLVDYVDKVINKGLSYMKKNYSLAQWKDMAILVRWAIDRCFRVYALRDQSLTGSLKLLKEVRARLDQANTVRGVGKLRPDGLERIIPGLTIGPDGVINGLDPNTATRNAQIKQLEDAGAILSPLSKKKSTPEAKVLDVREFLLESYPDWTVVDFGEAMQDGQLSLSKIKLKVPRYTRDEMTIVMPSTEGLDWVENTFKRIEYAIRTNNLLTASEYAFFKRTAETGVFGRKPAEQQKDPDKDK